MFKEFAHPLGEQIIAWAHPAGWIASPLEAWPLTSFEFALGTAMCYLTFVFVGMVVMRALPAVPGLYPFKFLYNMVQIMLCSYMCIESGVRAWDAGYSWLPCNAFNASAPPIGFILYVFYLSKILDFLDTVFIIAEKRWGQLSFLHVYHHTSIFLVS
jgi:elongation of very long chain fatty acids protein 4